MESHYNSNRFVHQKRRKIIEPKITALKKFAKCNNSKCNIVYLFDPRKVIGVAGLLCPSCVTKLDTHHFVQCTNCETIINFMEAEPSEIPVMFYVEKCSKCNGTLEDERNVVPYFYLEAYI